MTVPLSRTAVCTALLLSTLVSPGAAQSTREEWLALRTRKQARHHRLPAPATRPDALNITVIRFFSDPSGNLVGVGEARNDSAFDLSYSRINFTFRDAAGAELGREWTYLHGGVNARLIATDAYETLLLPGATGFFKVWTTIPASQVASHTARLAGEDIAYMKPSAAHSTPFGSPVGRPEAWVPWVFARARVAEGRISGIAQHDDPNGFAGDPAFGSPYFTHAIQISAATYEDGVITDVQSTMTLAPLGFSGRQPVVVDPCRGQPVIGLNSDTWVEFTLDSPRAFDSFARLTTEWHEVLVSREQFTIAGAGGQASFSVNRECGWTAQPTVPWITIRQGAESNEHGGVVTFVVERNPGTGLRFGSILVSGEVVTVRQGRWCDLVPAPVLYAAAGRTRLTAFSAPASCLVGISFDSPWIRVASTYFEGAFQSADALYLDIDANFTAAARRAVVRIGEASFAVEQSAGARPDFNADGQMDLLWHHRDGWVATWRMRGVQMIDGTLLAPPRMDRAWVPRTAVDWNGDGATDVVWQNTTNGDSFIWRMSGTSLVAEGSGGNMGSGTDANWRIRGGADFNFDGIPDLIWNKQDTGGLFTTLSREGIAPLGPGLVADVNWIVVGTGDFNRDGLVDLVWQHETDGRIAVWTMRGTSLIDGIPLSPGRVADLDWKIRAVGDMNGDDWPDLIWQHRTDGRVAVWLMNGTAMMTGTVIGRVADTNWQIVGPR